jgi:hypothetical protein
MRMLDGLAYLDKQVETVGGRELILIAVVGDLDAAHQLHDEEWRPVPVAPASKTFAMGWSHQRQSLPLGLEPGDDLRGVHAQLDDFERDARRRTGSSCSAI